MSLMCKEINEAAKTIGTSLTESSVDIIDHWLEIHLLKRY